MAKRKHKRKGKHKLTRKKAKTMLRENRARGKKLTKKQKRFFGFIAGGGRPTRLKRKKGRKKKKKHGKKR